MLRYVGIIALLAYLLKLSGFCFSEPGWQTDRELIESAFRIETARKGPLNPSVPDVASYLRDFPQCCSVGNSDDTMLINALFGRRFHDVTIKYPVMDVAENEGEPFYEAILIMDCCGDDVVDRYGIGFSTPIPAGPPVKSSELAPSKTDVAGS